MNDKIEVLNRFMGWEPNRHCRDMTCTHPERYHSVCGYAARNPHNVPPFDPYADTPEAREWARKLKDEFVRRNPSVDLIVHTVHTCLTNGEVRFACEMAELSRGRYVTKRRTVPIEHHAILDAIYEAIRQEK